MSIPCLRIQIVQQRQMLGSEIAQRVQFTIVNKCLAVQIAIVLLIPLQVRQHDESGRFVGIFKNDSIDFVAFFAIFVEDVVNLFKEILFFNLI